MDKSLDIYIQSIRQRDFQTALTVQPLIQEKSKRYYEAHLMLEFLRHGGMDARSENIMTMEAWFADYGHEMLSFCNDADFFHQVGHFLGYVRTDDNNQPIPYFEEDVLEIVWRFHNTQKNV